MFAEDGHLLSSSGLLDKFRNLFVIRLRLQGLHHTAEQRKMASAVLVSSHTNTLPGLEQFYPLPDLITQFLQVLNKPNRPCWTKMQLGHLLHSALQLLGHTCRRTKLVFEFPRLPS